MQVLYYCADISGSLFIYLFIYLLFLFNKKRRQQLDDSLRAWREKGTLKE